MANETNPLVHLRVPSPIYDQVRGLADSEDRSILNMLLRLIKEGLAARGIANPTPGES